MRDYLVFDLGETLIDFNQQGKWHENLLKEVIPDMFSNLQNFSDNYIQNVVQNLQLESFSRLVYENIALKAQKHIAMTTRIKKYLQFFGFPITPAITACQISAFHTNLMKYAYLYEDVLPTLEYLKRQGYYLGLWSNTPWQSPGTIFHQIMKDFNIHHYFDYLFFSGDYEIQKPDPQTLQIVSTTSKIPKEQMVYIGNSEVDILTGERYGIPTVWINREGRKLNSDSPLPTLEIAKMGDLPSYLPFT